MATIPSPSATEIQHHANVTAQMLAAEDDAALRRDVNNLILPGVLGRVELTADEAALPYDYPLATTVYAAAFPDLTTGERSERAERIESMFRLAILNLGASLLSLRVRRSGQANFSDETSAQKAKEFEERGADMLETARKAVAAVVSRAQNEAGVNTGSGGAFDFSVAAYATSAAIPSDDGVVVNGDASWLS